jgi:hypothetical protein
MRTTLELKLWFYWFCIWGVPLNSNLVVPLVLLYSLALLSVCFWWGKYRSFSSWKAITYIKVAHGKLYACDTTSHVQRLFSQIVKIITAMIWKGELIGIHQLRNYIHAGKDCHSRFFANKYSSTCFWMPDFDWSMNVDGTKTPNP